MVVLIRVAIHKNLIRKESADVVIVIESLERKKTYLSSIQIFCLDHVGECFAAVLRSYHEVDVTPDFSHQVVSRWIIHALPMMLLISICDDL